MKTIRSKTLSQTAAFLVFGAASFVPSPQLLFAQGSLTPPGAPAPTMKTLDQVEARTPIAGGTSTVTISQHGSYYLTGDIAVSTGNGIVISADKVTLDLNGFTVSSSAASANGFGVLVSGFRSSIYILNGYIQGTVTYDGSTYSGGGFGGGIFVTGASFNVRVVGMSVSGCLNDGIYLGTESTLVEACTVRTVGSSGIVASIVKSSVAKICGNTGIFGDQVSDSGGQSTGFLPGIYASTALNCTGSSVSAEGIRATTASNCYGYSAGDGISAQTADNCYGTSTSNGRGISAQTANNCHGDSSTSQGIYAETATNCYGQSTSNRGLFANVAIASSGYCNNGGSYGLFATSIANTCYGYSASGTGINAYILIGCTGNTIAYTYHYNMPP